MSCWSIAELTAGALACTDERSVSVVLNAGEVLERKRETAGGATLFVKSDLLAFLFFWPCSSFDQLWPELLRCSSELVPELILYEALFLQLSAWPRTDLLNSSCSELGQLGCLLDLTVPA
ncbi:hypothetical protein F511_41112 [Dorcoceras hygrometricum]|uniref:Uncharacterized protein n=1 Tax=Dorcoceras hygrometricum TaxID=472368 RepID=A0A2Z7CU35_9LAMI|nr:hypothetical protein F511_41112 [Dorcoceras hygrometricum]